MAKLPTAATKKAPAKATSPPPEPDPSADDGPVAAPADTEPTPAELAAAEADPEPTKPARATRKAKAAGDPSKGVSTAALDDLDEFVNICYYGTEGSGKTTDAMFAANGGRTLVINAEAGIKGRRLRQLGVATENIVIWPDPKTGETISFEGLERLFWEIKGDLLENPTAWYAIVWDSITEIHKALLDEVVAHQVAKAERAGKDRERFFIDRADYGTMTEQMRLLARRFRDLPCHFIITALERRDTDDDGKVAYGPAVTPALMTDIGGMVDLLLHCRVAEGLDEDGEPLELYMAYTRKGTKYRAKDRWSVTPRLMANPFFDRIVAYVNDELVSAEDPVQAQARAAVARLEKREEERKEAKGKRTAA